MHFNSHKIAKSLNDKTTNGPTYYMNKDKEETVSPGLVILTYLRRLEVGLYI